MELYELHTWSLIFVFAILALTLGIGFLLLGKKYSANFNGLTGIGISIIIIAIGTALNSFQLNINPLAGIFLSNLLILSGVFLIYISANKYLKNRIKITIEISIGLTAIILMIVFFINNYFKGRIIVFSSFIAIYFFRLAWLFIKHSKKHNKRAHNPIAILFICMALVNIYRCIEALLSNSTNILENDAGKSFVILIMIFFTLIMSINFLNIILNELDFIKNIFMSTMAHELRTPFNSIIGFSNLLTIEEPEESKTELFANYIQQSAVSGMQSLDNLLEWTKTKIGKIQLNQEALNIEKIFDLTIKLNNSIIEFKKLNVSKKISSADFVADNQLITLIISNLVTNSIKFSPKGGNITFKSGKKDNSFYFSVENTGEPLSKEEIKNLYVNDVLVSKKGTDNEKGTGLGLYIVKSFVEILKGKLIIESDNNSNKFTIEIPGK